MFQPMDIVTSQLSQIQWGLIAAVKLEHAMIPVRSPVDRSFERDA
jgi:hypothetical protein